MACVSLSARMPWGISDENGLECRTEKLGGKVLFCSWVVMAVSSWGVCPHPGVRPAVPWGRNSWFLGSVRGEETQELLLLLQGRESPGWHGGKNSPPHSTGPLGKTCVCIKCHLLNSNYYTEMILNVMKAAEPQISGALAGDAMVQVVCHGQSTHHAWALPGCAWLEDARVPRCLGS